MKWLAKAPANIALIKYMGKEDEQKNIPSNSSLSYTLNKLQSFVELEQSSSSDDIWEPLTIPGAFEFDLTKEQKHRYLNHLQYIKNHYNSDKNFIVRSCNNFPHGTGLASSASSFAALTICAIRALFEIQNFPLPDSAEMAKISQFGSGSSCRSFFKPWALWTPEGVSSIDLPYNDLIHLVIVITHDIKKIPSLEAHKLVQTSPLFAHRQENIESRIKTLIELLNSQNWLEAFDVVWQEFTEMHHLFETASPSFSYMTTASKNVLNELKYFWHENNDGPLVTMDAGPNIHLLFRSDQKEMATDLQNYFIKSHDVI